jgi:uncharacterized protein (UPF0264 family)
VLTKDGRGLFHWLGETELAAFVEECRARGLFSALAGSLRAEDLARLAPIGPDLVGVRGAACAASTRPLVRPRLAALPSGHAASG